MKIKKAPKAKVQKSSSAPTIVDQPGSELLKEAYLVMAPVEDMEMEEKKKNVALQVIRNLKKLAKKKCTLGENEKPKKRSPSNTQNTPSRRSSRRFKPKN